MLRGWLKQWILNIAARYNYFQATGISLNDANVSFCKKGYELESEARDAIRTVRDYTKVSYERLCTLWNQIAHLERFGIDGSIVECGTWRGGCCGLMALAVLRHGRSPRHFHLFDSFEGLPEPRGLVDGKKAVEYSDQRDFGTLARIGKCIGAIESNKRLLEEIIGYPTDYLHYHKGWFQNTVPDSKITVGPIALLRLDCDWYDSTRMCLDHLFYQVARGGFLVVDDYGHWEGCRKAVEEFLLQQEMQYYLHYIDYTGRYLIK